MVGNNEEVLWVNPKVDPARETGVAHIYYLYKRNEKTEEA